MVFFERSKIQIVYLAEYGKSDFYAWVKVRK